MVADGDFVVPPRTHSKVPVINPLGTGEQNAVHGTFGYVSPITSLATCMVAHGVADSPTWVQVANPGDVPLVLRHGSQVCYFHSREQWKTEPAFTDPTVEEIKADQRARQATHRETLSKNRHSTDIATKTLERWNDGSDFQTGHAHIQHVGDNGQGKGLITPTPPESYDVINGEWQHTTDRAKPPPEFQKSEWQYTANRVKPPPGYIATSPSGVSDISMQGAIPLSDRGTLPTCIRQGGLCQVTVSPRMRAGQRPSFKHKLGSEVEPMTDDPIPLVEQNAALFCDTIGPLRHSGGMDDNASHVPKHALREQQCGRTLDEDSEPERIEIVTNLESYVAPQKEKVEETSSKDVCSIYT